MMMATTLIFLSGATAFPLSMRRAALSSYRATLPQCTIAVFGGTGGVGGEAVYQALARGESVVTLARDPSRMRIPVGSGGNSAGQPLKNEKLTVFQGSVTSKADVDKCFTGRKLEIRIVSIQWRADAR